jgi:phosphoglycolate phosphatase
MNPYRLIIFDFDGTLAATEPSIQFCMKTAFLEYGLTPPSENTVRSAIGIPLTEMIHSFNGVKTLKQAEVITEIYRKYYRKEGQEMTVLFDGALGVVERLYKRGYGVAEEVVRKSVELKGLAPFCSFVIGEREDIMQKPHPQAFTDLLAPHFGVEPHECLMVGDALPDMEFAANSGMDACWASYGFGSKEDFGATIVKFVINDIAELDDILGV